MPKQLNVRDVAQAALAAHADRRLCAQNLDQHRDDPNSSNAFYINDDYPGVGCAIGVAMDHDTAHFAQNAPGYEIDRIIASHPHLLSSDDPDALRKLQRAHDDWVTTAAAGPGFNIAKREQEFLTLAKELAA